MDKRQNRVVLAERIEKENDHKNVNKRNGESLGKVDKLQLNKKLIQDREIIASKNSKDIRAPSKSVVVKTKQEVKIPADIILNNTQQFCHLYAEELVETTKNEAIFGNFLERHDIDKTLRARMLDWMIEVISSYKFTPKTYFTSVQLMDRYFSQQNEKLPITKLHIIGVVSMLIATKMDQVFPLKIKTVHDKIVHQKISKRQIIDMEARMSEKLDFILNSWSFYDHALLRLHKSQSKNEEALKEIEKYCDIVGKFIVFNYQAYGKYPSTALGEALLHVSCKIFGLEKISDIIGNIKSYEFEQTPQCISEILKTVRSFKSGFKNLTNIYRFSDENTIKSVEKFAEKFIDY